MATPKPISPKKPTYGAPEKPNVVRLAMIWGFIIIGIAAIVYMIATNAPQKRLNCSKSSASLIEFGTCTEE